MAKEPFVTRMLESTVRSIGFIASNWPAGASIRLSVKSSPFRDTQVRNSVFPRFGGV